MLHCRPLLAQLQWCLAGVNSFIISNISDNVLLLLLATRSKKKKVQNLSSLTISYFKCIQCNINKIISVVKTNVGHKRPKYITATQSSCVKDW